MCVRVCCRWNFLSGAPTSIYAIRQMGRLAFGAHRGECLEQFRLVPRHIDDVIAQVAAVGVAQPFLRKPHEEALFPFIEVAARRRLCAGQRRLQRCPMIDVAQAASMASGVIRRLISSTSGRPVPVGTMNSTKKWPLMPKPAASDSAIERNCGERK